MYEVFWVISKFMLVTGDIVGNSKRNINIELLRIISMLMIVYHHYYVHSGWAFPNDFSGKAAFIIIMGSMGKIGVILFVLITGYFYSQQEFKLKKIFTLSNAARWYSILSLFIVIFFTDMKLELTAQEIVPVLFPIEFNYYWFLTPYVIILLLNPFLKNYLVSIEREKKLRVTLLFIGVLHIPALIGIVTQTDNYFIPDSILSFISFVLVGDLLKNYEHELSTKYFKYVSLLFIFSGMLILYKGLFYQPYAVKSFPELPSFFLTGTESINALIFSATLFLIVLKKVSIKRKIILFVAPLVFDVYLLHDNRYIRPLIWQIIFNNKDSFDSSWLIFRSIFEPLLVFMICLLFAFVRFSVLSLIKRKFQRF